MDALDSLASIAGAQDSTVAPPAPEPQDAAATAPQEPSHNMAQSPSPQTSAQAPPHSPPPSPPAPAVKSGHEPGPPGSGIHPANAKPQTPLHPGSGTGTGTPPTTPSNTTGDAPPLPPAQPCINVTIPDTTAGPAANPLPPGTNNCLTEPFCGAGEECFVLTNGLVCMPKAQNWGYILSRNASGIPSVPSWSGPYSQQNNNCTRFQMPASGDKPGLAVLVYDLIRDTLPKDLLLSRFDKSTTNWYTQFSYCVPSLTCSMGICQPRPALNESCTSSWQCNALALGLDAANILISTANTTEMRCEYLDGDKSVNTTCQLLHREEGAAQVFEDRDEEEFSAWHVIVPVVVILIVVYFGTVAYQRRMRQEQRRKWTRSIEDDFHMEAYEEIH
ncbi:hypothetical protein BGW39_000496 [Mortierella sp. 14UC]|nr:hypothetical protein BGW39_000496 [Mortierella sp. 14UC]